jgi:benzylsuccinate CoA-transferase BbsF subunit
MPGLGCTGPKRHYATVGVNITAFTGFTYLWNHPSKVDPPIGAQTVFPDYVSGVMSALLIVAAALYRDRNRRGAFIDLSQGEAAAYMIGASLIEAQALGGGGEPKGNECDFAAPHGCYRCGGEERWCVIAVETDEQWWALSKMLGGGASEDRRFASLEGRLAHKDEINALVEGWTRERDPFEVMEALQKVGVPCGVAQNGADLLADPHLRERGFIVEAENRRLGRVILPAFPLRFAGCVMKPRWEFPELGRDTEDVLRGVLGYSPEQIGKLAKDGVLE